VALPRRLFLVATGAALAAFSLRALGDDTVPAILDHILLGCGDLDMGVDFVEGLLGVRAEFGGVHPGRGTQNALLSLGDRHYLEIIAPDLKQNTASASPMVRADLLSHLYSLKTPSLVGWAAHPGNLKAFAKKLRDAGISFEGPTPGSRKRPDGRLLQWQTLNLQDDDSGLLPFFIEWAPDSPHPATDAPGACSLAHFALASRDPAALKKKAALLDLEVAIQKNEKKQIRATFRGPKGLLNLTS
jgi:catechol 2,3-dioxygenase-like lactoylglutathione lyase family enzyme